MIRQYWDQAKRQLAVMQLPQLSERFDFASVSEAFDSFAILCCFDQHLILTSIKANQSRMMIDECFSIDLPTHLIGDSGVENPNEVSQIVLDLMDVMGLSSSPVLLLLSSSKFSHISFAADKITAWDLTDPKIRGKSPFLPDETLIHLRSSEHQSLADHSMRAVSYANTHFIHSWVNVLRAVGQPVLGISPLYSGLIDWLPDFKGSQKSAIFCDVEPNCCNLLIKNKSFGFSSVQLPFGTSLYIGQSSRLWDQFFKRLKSSLDFVVEEQDLGDNIPCIFSGYGLSGFAESLPTGFEHWTLLNKLTSEMLLVSDHMKIDELRHHQYLFPQLAVCLSSYCQP